MSLDAKIDRGQFCRLLVNTSVGHIEQQLIQHMLDYTSDPLEFMANVVSLKMPQTLLSQVEDCMFLSAKKEK